MTGCGRVDGAVRVGASGPVPGSGDRGRGGAVPVQGTGAAPLWSRSSDLDALEELGHEGGDG